MHFILQPNGFIRSFIKNIVQLDELVEMEKLLFRKLIVVDDDGES